MVVIICGFFVLEYFGVLTGVATLLDNGLDCAISFIQDM